VRCNTRATSTELAAPTAVAAYAVRDGGIDIDGRTIPSKLRRDGRGTADEARYRARMPARLALLDARFPR
jgi:hypothetical protein